MDIAYRLPFTKANSVLPYTIHSPLKYEINLTNRIIRVSLVVFVDDELAL